MTQPFDWDLYYGEYRTSGTHLHLPVVLGRLAAPTDEDALWLIEGLKDARKWFVAEHFYRAPAIAEIFFQPLMDAGIDECEPSNCRPFITSCSTMFGHRRALEYLHDVIETECDTRKTGALLSLYMTAFPSGGVACTPTSKTDRRSRKDLKVRQMELILNTYLRSSDRLVRVAALRELPMLVTEYPEHLRPLAIQVIEAAKKSESRHIRQIVEQGLTENPTTFVDTWPSELVSEG